MIEIAYFNIQKYPVTELFVKKIVRKAAGFEKKLTGTVEISLVDNRRIRALNKVWRGQDKATDVLSFAWREESKIKSPLIGQIFVSYPKIVSQAADYKVAVEKELSRMIVHGLLHLCGHEHAEAGRAKKMFALQEKIIDKIA